MTNDTTYSNEVPHPIIPGVEIELAGTVYVVPPISLGALQRFQKRLKTFGGGAGEDDYLLVSDCTLAALKRNYPDITMEHLTEQLLDISNMNDVMMAVMDAAGIKRKEQEAERLAARTST